MLDPFILDLEHNGKKYELEAQLLTIGYTHKFRVTIQKNDYYFESDEEGNYRAVIPFEALEKSYAPIDTSLLEAVAQQIAEILR